MSAARFENAKTRFSREERHVEERVRGPALPGDEGREQHEAEPRRAPAPRGGGQPAQAVHERARARPRRGPRPGTSRRSPGDSRHSPTRPHAASAAATAPRATLARKTLRQPSCCVSRPPSGGPSERPRYTAATFTPRARPRFPGGKIEVSSATPVPKIIPPPSALGDPPGEQEREGRRERAERRRHGVDDEPAHEDALPSRGCRPASRRGRGRRRPTAGRRWPPSSRSTASRPISRPIAGRATFVAEPMKGVRKDASVATTRATRSFVRGGGAHGRARAPRRRRPR